MRYLWYACTGHAYQWLLCMFKDKQYVCICVHTSGYVTKLKHCNKCVRYIHDFTVASLHTLSSTFFVSHKSILEEFPENFMASSMVKSSNGLNDNCRNNLMVLHGLLNLTSNTNRHQLTVQSNITKTMMHWWIDGTTDQVCLNSMYISLLVSSYLLPSLPSPFLPPLSVSLHNLVEKTTDYFLKTG